MSGVYLASCLEGRKSRDIPEGARPVSANKRAIMFFLVSSQPVILMIESTSNRGTLPPFFFLWSNMAEEDQTERRPHSTKQRFLFRGREVDQLVCVHVSLLSVCVCATGNRALMSCGRERVNSIFEYWPAEPQDGILFSSTEPLSRVVLFQAHTHTGHLTPPTICLLRKRERVLYSSAILSNVRLFRTFPVFFPSHFLLHLEFYTCRPTDGL